MTIRAERWRRLVAVGLTSALMVLGPVLLAPSAASAAAPSHTGLCWYHYWFGGRHFCPADPEGVASTRYGTGRRVWLGQAEVSAVDDDSVSFAFPDGCEPYETFCDTFTFLSVPWTGTHRPRAGIEVRLYGTTTEGSLTPTGYIRTGDCFYVQVCAD